MAKCLPECIWTTTILDFVGYESQYLFLGTVSKLWRSKFFSTKTRVSEALLTPSRIKEVGDLSDGLSPVVRRRAWSIFTKITLNTRYSALQELGQELQKTIEWDPFCVSCAAKHNNVGFFDWLRTTTLSWDPDLAYLSNTTLGFMKCMHGTLGIKPSTRCLLDPGYVLSVGVLGLQWLQSIGCDLDEVPNVLALENRSKTRPLREWLSSTKM